MFSLSNLPSYLEILNQLARDAGKRIMEIRLEGIDATLKDDMSPVTRADREADALITAGLLAHFPAIPVISEEEDVRGNISQEPYFWLVDPLDGTKNFIRGGNGFTVNIGLIHNKQPILGVIYIPAQETLYYGAVGVGAFRQTDSEPTPTPISARTMPAQDRIGIISHDHAKEDTKIWLERYSITQTSSASSSQKFCRVAEGAADIYPRTGPTMEWDTAAGHAIVLAAGGSMTTLEETPFTYGKEGFLNGGFVVLGA